MNSTQSSEASAEPPTPSGKIVVSATYDVALPKHAKLYINKTSLCEAQGPSGILYVTERVHGMCLAVATQTHHF